MRNILLSLLAVLGTCFAPLAMASDNNQNNPHAVAISLGSPSVDALFPALYTGKKIVVTGAYLINGATITADNSNYVVLELKSGSNVIASLDTRAAHDGAVTLNVAKSLTVSSTYAAQASTATLTVNYDEQDAGTNVALTNAQLIVLYYVK